MIPMKLKDFNYISKYLNDRSVRFFKTGSRTLEALRDVLVFERTQVEAARDRGLCESTISRAVKKFPKSVCSKCKRPI